MNDLQLALDPAWGVGLVLALARMGAFVLATPMLGRVVPMPGRLAVSLALGFFFARPVDGSIELLGLIGLVVVNVVVGVVLAYLTGMLFHLFATAGSLVDLTSGLSASALIDPTMGEQAAVFSRLFNLIALTLFIVLGGMQLLVRGLALSIEVIPLDGTIAADADLVALTLRLLGRMLIAATELALPVLAALFLAELVLGLASRLAPQANIFLLGLPAKVLVTMSVVGVAVLLFPQAVDGFLHAVRDTFTDGLRGLAAP